MRCFELFYKHKEEKSARLREEISAVSVTQILLIEHEWKEAPIDERALPASPCNFSGSFDVYRYNE
jgi:hypothetical protein